MTSLSLIARWGIFDGYSDADFDAILIVRIHPFESWNYKILPHQNSHFIV
jgi:hypothetical protein